MTIQEPFRDNVIRRPLKVDGPASPGAQEWNPSSLEGREGIGCSWGSILCCAEKTALEEQAGAARSTDRRETRGMSHIGQCTLRSGVLNRECPWMRWYSSPAMELRPRARASAAQRELAPQMGRRSLQAGKRDAASS